MPNRAEGINKHKLQDRLPTSDSGRPVGWDPRPTLLTDIPGWGIVWSALCPSISNVVMFLCLLRPHNSMFFTFADGTQHEFLHTVKGSGLNYLTVLVEA